MARTLLASVPLALLTLALTSALPVASAASARAQTTDVREATTYAEEENATRFRAGGRFEALAATGSSPATALGIAGDVGVDLQSWLTAGGSLLLLGSTGNGGGCAIDGGQTCVYRTAAVVPFVEARSPGEGIVQPWGRVGAGAAALLYNYDSKPAVPAAVFTFDAGIDIRTAFTTFGPFFATKAFTTKNPVLVGGGARFEFTF